MYKEQVECLIKAMSFPKDKKLEIFSKILEGVKALNARKAKKHIAEIFLEFSKAKTASPPVTILHHLACSNNKLEVFKRIINFLKENDVSDVQLISILNTDCGFEKLSFYLIPVLVRFPKNEEGEEEIALIFDFLNSKHLLDRRLLIPQTGQPPLYMAYVRNFKSIYKFLLSSGEYKVWSLMRIWNPRT